MTRQKPPRRRRGSLLRASLALPRGLPHWTPRPRGHPQDSASAASSKEPTDSAGEAEYQIGESLALAAILPKLNKFLEEKEPGTKKHKKKNTSNH